MPILHEPDVVAEAYALALANRKVQTFLIGLYFQRKTPEALSDLFKLLDKWDTDASQRRESREK
jgi:hypothetical protein